MKMHNKILRIVCLLSTLLIISNHFIHAFSWSSFFKSDKPKQPIDQVKKLENQLVHDPKNPYINYNLGVALYKNKRFDEAKNNFERAVLYATDTTFKEQSYFNLANCLYKNALTILPENWESPDQEVDIKILDQAASLASNSIKEYDSVLSINEKNEKAITNKKEAEKLLRKILEKKKQQEQEKPDKPNQDDQDQNNKDNKNQDEKDKDSEKKDKNGNKKDQKSGKNQSKKDDTQDQNGEPGEEKNGKKDDQQQSSENKKDKKQEQRDQSQGQQNQNKNQDTSSEQDNKEQREQDGKKSKPEQGREKDSPQDHNQPDKNREDNPGESEQKENNKNNVGHDEQPKNDPKDKQQSPSQGIQPEDEKQENDTEQEGMFGSADQEDGTEKRVFRAILDNLDTDESKLQKHMIMQKTKGQKPPVGNMQKPW